MAYKPEYDAKRVRRNSYSCRLSDKEEELVNNVNSALGACTIREAVLACYMLAADNLGAAKEKLEEVKRIE